MCQQLQSNFKIKALAVESQFEIHQDINKWINDCDTDKNKTNQKDLEYCPAHKYIIDGSRLQFSPLRKYLQEDFLTEVKVMEMNSCLEGAKSVQKRGRFKKKCLIKNVACLITC